ncbi:MAG: type I restriction-modification system subunit M N-terminal domain-containing protein [Candidatus Syntrophopropionicum ammoniitolerans]
MNYITTKEAANKWGLTPRRVQALCKQGKIPGVCRLGWAWAIPKNAVKPRPTNGKPDTGGRGRIVNNTTYNQIVSFIWGIADDCLRDVYVRGKYRDVILPMTVIRRLDAVLEETKKDVLEMKKQLDEAGILNQTVGLCSAAGQSFFNSSLFTLKDLRARSGTSS